MRGMYIEAFGKAEYETLSERLGLEEETEEFEQLLRAQDTLT